MKRLITSLLFVFLTLVIIYGQNGDKKIDLMDANGDTVSLNLNILERPLIISTFAVGCGHCMKEMKAYSEKYTEWKRKYNIDIIAATSNYNKKYISKHVVPFVQNNKYSFKIYIDYKYEMATSLIQKEGIQKELFPVYKENLVMRIPQTIIIDKNGQLVYQKLGFTDGDEQKVEDVIKNL